MSDHYLQRLHEWYEWIMLPSFITLFPLPVGLLGRTTTSMDWMRSAFRLCSSCSACKDAQLNLSEPQKRIRRGSDLLGIVLYGLRNDDTRLTAVRTKNRVRGGWSISL